MLGNRASLLFARKVRVEGAVEKLWQAATFFTPASALQRRERNAPSLSSTTCSPSPQTLPSHSCNRHSLSLAVGLLSSPHFHLSFCSQLSSISFLFRFTPKLPPSPSPSPSFIPRLDQFKALSSLGHHPISTLTLFQPFSASASSIFIHYQQSLPTLPSRSESRSSRGLGPSITFIHLHSPPSSTTA